MRVCVHMYAAKCFAVIKITLLVVIHDVLVIKFYCALVMRFCGHQTDLQASFRV